MMDTGGMTPPPKQRPPGKYTQKVFADEMIGVWERTPLPADAKVTHVTLVPYRGEKAVVAWRNGGLTLPEGDVEAGESAEAAVRRIVYAQTGVKDPQIHHLGHYKVTATAKSTTLPPDTVTYHVLYALDANEYDDFPGDQSYERRIVLQRDLNNVIRNQMMEHRMEYAYALDDWLLERMKANAAR